MGTNKKTFGTRTKISALGASLGSMEGIYFNHSNSSSACLVSDEALQLVETPIAQPEVHSLPSSYFSNSFKVFHNNGVSIKVIHYLLTDVMIAPSHELFFSSRNPPEKFSAGTSAFTLKLGSQSFESKFCSLDILSIEELPVRCNSNIVYSEVNAKNSILEARAFDINLFGESEQEETSAFFIYPQQTFSNIPMHEIFFVAFWNRYFESLPSFDGSNSEAIFLERGTSWEIVSDRTSLNNWFGFSFFNHSTRLLNTSNRKLARQSYFPERLVDKGMKLDIVSNPSLPCLINAELHGFVINLEGFNNFRSCFNLDFSCCSCFHANMEDSNIYKLIGGDGSSPKSKQKGIRAIGE